MGDGSGDGIGDRGAPLQLPASVTKAIWCQRLLLVISGIGTLFTVLLRDRLIRAWAEGNPSAREILREGGLDALLESDTVHPPAFVPVAVVLFLVMWGLMQLLGVFFREGYNWARLSLVLVALEAALAAFIIGFKEDPPLIFTVLAVVMLVVDAAWLYFLLHKDTNAYLRGAWLVHHDEAEVGS